jgi:Zn-dependent protease with chaperone function
MKAAPLARALTLLQRQQPDESQTPRWLKNTMGYLSTHPGTQARIARLRAKDAEDEEEEDED